MNFYQKVLNFLGKKKIKKEKKEKKPKFMFVKGCCRFQLDDSILE